MTTTSTTEFSYFSSMEILMKGPLYLSPRNSQSPVIVPTNLSNRLCSYQVDAVRYLYRAFTKGHNVILNNEVEMNNARQICAFLSAVSRSGLALVICNCKALAIWHYELSQIGGFKVAFGHKTMTQNDVEVVLLTHDLLKNLRNIPVKDWFFLIVDDLDAIVHSRYLKSIVSRYKIGLTSRSFLLYPDQKLQFKLIKWANPNFAESEESFIKTDKYRKKNLKWPYPENWQRLTWYMYEHCKPSESILTKYHKTVSDWSNENCININSTEKQSISKNTRKSKSTKAPKRKYTRKSTLQKRLRITCKRKPCDSFWDDSSDDQMSEKEIRNENEEELKNNLKKNEEKSESNVKQEKNEETSSELIKNYDINIVKNEPKTSFDNIAIAEENFVLNSLIEETSPIKEEKLVVNSPVKDENQVINSPIKEERQINNCDIPEDAILNSLVETDNIIPISNTNISEELLDEDSCNILNSLL